MKDDKTYPANGDLCRDSRREARYFKVETFGAVDGPGLRFVLFLQGCLLRCPYCHNPESWPLRGGNAIAARDVIARFNRYRGYYKRGGMTLSGGEPLMQAEFALELFALCREQGIHTALDTSGCVTSLEALAAVDAADLLLLDIKHADPSRHRDLFGFPLEAPLEALRRRERAGKPVWVRHVVVPGMTDGEEEIAQLAALLAPFQCIERVELLPFRKLCLEKYRELGIPFPLEGVPESSSGRTTL